MTIEEKILEAAEAIKSGKKVTYRQYLRGSGDGWVELRFLEIDFKIEEPI